LVSKSSLQVQTTGERKGDGWAKPTQPGKSRTFLWFENCVIKKSSCEYQQSSSSPRRVAVPVLVKDGKPCSGSSNSTPVQQHLTSSGSTIGNSSSNTINLINAGSGGGGNSNETATSNNQHSPVDSPSTTILSSYNSSGGHQQMLQQPCNNTLMSNSLAMAYRNQNNFMSNSHQQQHCGSYLPLQGRAW
jgi:homeobox protein Nkx-2.1